MSELNRTERNCLRWVLQRTLEQLEDEEYHQLRRIERQRLQDPDSHRELKEIRMRLVTVAGLREKFGAFETVPVQTPEVQHVDVPDNHGVSNFDAIRRHVLSEPTLDEQRRDTEGG